MSSLALIDKGTGELVSTVDARSLLAAAGISDVLIAGNDQLAAFMSDADELRRVAAEAKGKAGDELIARMDRNGKWTLHTTSYEVKSASPEAGSVAYDIDRLCGVLDGLAASGVISYEGSAAAVETIQPTVAVSYLFLRDVLRALDGVEPSDQVYEEIRGLLLGESDPVYKIKPAGVKALLKVPAARSAIESCQVTVEAPRRTARVRRVA